MRPIVTYGCPSYPCVGVWRAFLFVVLVVECVANSSVEFCHEYARGEVDHFGEVAHHVDGDGRFEAFESLPYVGVGYSHMFA